MVTTERWHHGTSGFGFSVSCGLLHLHGFGWSFELEWGDKDKGAGWVRRRAMRALVRRGEMTEVAK